MEPYINENGIFLCSFMFGPIACLDSSSIIFFNTLNLKLNHLQVLYSAGGSEGGAYEEKERRL